MATQSALLIDETKIKKAIQSSIPLTITTYTLPHEVETYIEDILAKFLSELGYEHLKDHLAYCIRELAVNAKKANTKRVFFTERGLDIEDPDDYKEGMLNFKTTTLENIGHYLQLQKDKGLYVKIIYFAQGNRILFEVRNNVVATKTELVRIQDKLARSRQYHTLEEALTQVLDDTEGAGLGLVILILMLKKMGLDDDSFDITTSETETISRISIALSNTTVENIDKLSKQIVDNISSLPQFPDNILRIQNLIADPKSEMADIARNISMDPAMTADLLKIVNSAQFMLSKKVDNIAEAVKLVGIRGIKNLLFSYGTQKILADDSEEIKQLWAHSYRTAFYSYNLAKNFRRDKNLLDDVYVGGILHDMGKIVFRNAHPSLMNSILKFSEEKGIPKENFEKLSAGLNHAEIGALIAEKWNFPENLIAAIRHHHTPFYADPSHSAITEAVYLANMFCNYEEGSVYFEQFDRGILAKFSISNEAQLKNIIDKFSQGFKRDGSF